MGVIKGKDLNIGTLDALPFLAEAVNASMGCHSF